LSWHPRYHNVIWNVVHNHCSRGDYCIPAETDALPDNGPRPDERPLGDVHGARQPSSYGNVYVIANPAIVLDNGSRIDDDVVT
jgi:hypothetical protein